MKFIDLFAGLGGFNIGLSQLGHECVFSCEINEGLAQLYEKNFGIIVFRDIRKLVLSENIKNISYYDILCAGFPCQPFSKAGKQGGFGDLQNGEYLDYIVKILKATHPKFFILENVPNLRKHDREETWKKIKKKLSDECGYEIKEDILSPHEFGIPQIRRRLFIVGSKNSLNYFKFPEKGSIKGLDVLPFLDKNPKNAVKINKEQKKILNLWQKIINKIPKKDKLPSFPIWGMEFGCNYPYEKMPPSKLPAKELGKYKGIFGASLKNLSKEDQLKLLPRYARTDLDFPDWKKEFIRKNRDFFSKYSSELKPLMKELKKFLPSWQKFEWNCLDDNRDIREHLIQFRPSGIRVKRTNYFPALVVNSSQKPIIGWEERYITPKEAARLQSLQKIKLPKNYSASIKHLGNAVNAEIVKRIGEKLLH